MLVEPPDALPGEGHAVPVPGVDSDGNDGAGIRAPMVPAPLATYTGWNLRTCRFGLGAMHECTASTIPLPETAEVAAPTRDPRRSIEERYGDAQGCVAAIEAAARRVVAERLTLAADVARCVVAAAHWHASLHGVDLD